jgi:hypothetical protein
MMAKKLVLTASLVASIFSAFMYKNYNLERKFCFPDGAQCVRVSGSWEGSEFLQSNRSLIIVKTPWFGEENVMEIIRLEPEILETLSQSGVVSGAQVFSWGEVGVVNEKYPEIVRIGLDSHFKDKKFLTNQKMILSCTDFRCIEDIKDFSGFK